MPRFDQAKRKRGKRHGPERGVWVFFPAEQLRELDREQATDGGAPFYRTSVNVRGRASVQFYRDA